MRYASLAFFLLAAAVALSFRPAHALTVRVPADQPTIQAGLNAAANGDTVLVAPGTYTGAANRNLDFQGKAIVLRASGGAAVTTIDGQLASRLFHFHSAEPATAAVEGFTLRRGSAGLEFGGAALVLGASPTFRNCVFSTCDGNEGGAIYFDNSSSQVISCSFTDNTAANWGGAFRADESPLVFTGCTFTHNAAAIGAGGHATGSVTLAFSNCPFSNNDAASTGGALYAENATLNLEDCAITGSNVNASGGAIHIAGGALSADNCQFAQNSARNRGGAIAMLTSTSLTLSDCAFESNSLANGSFPRAGGGLYVQSIQTLSLERCTFTGNSTTGSSGCRGGGCAVHVMGEATITDCTFTGNTSAGHGGGGYFGNFDPGTMTGCVFTGNIAQNTGNFGGGGAHIGGTWVVTQCQFTDNQSASVGGGISATSGNGPITLDQCLFARNSAAEKGGGCELDGAAIATNCTWHDNSAPEGGGFILGTTSGASGNMSNCTLVQNSAALGAGASLGSTSFLTMHHSIIAGSTSGASMNCNPSSTPVLSCCDIFGNAGGDWVACIAEQLGINGCFSADPRFCNPLADDFRLAATSPCAPANSPAGCGLIGAHPVGCAAPIGVSDHAVTPIAGEILRLEPNPLVGDGAGKIFWQSSARGAAANPWLKLYDLSGRLVGSHRVSPSHGPQELPWSVVAGPRLSSGIYWLALESQGDRQRVERVVIVR